MKQLTGEIKLYIRYVFIFFIFILL